MSGTIRNTALLAAVSGVLAAGVGCTVDAVVYDHPHRDRVVIVDQTPPPPETVVVAQPAPVQEEVIVDAPPPPPAEVIVASPGPDYIYVQGSWTRVGGRWVWARGRWDRPPYGHRHWAAAHWEHRGHGWVRIEGRWD